MKKDYTVLLIQLDRNLASDVSTRCSGRPQGMNSLDTSFHSLRTALVETSEAKFLSS